MAMPPVKQVKGVMRLDNARKTLLDLQKISQALPSHFVQAHDMKDKQGNDIQSINHGLIDAAIESVMSELDYREHLFDNRGILVSYLADQLFGCSFMEQKAFLHKRVCEFEARYDNYEKLELGPVSYISILGKNGYDNGFQFFKSFEVFIELEDDAGIEKIMLVLRGNSGLIDCIVDVNGFNHSYGSIKSLIFKDGGDVKIFKPTPGPGSDMNWEEFV